MGAGMTPDTFGLREAWLRSRSLAQTALKEASERCEEHARAIAAYESAKAAKCLEMRAEGEPATLIHDVVDGIEPVNSRLFEKVLSEGKYKAAMKAVDVYREDERMTYDEYRRSMQGDRWQ